MTRRAGRGGQVIAITMAFLLVALACLPIPSDPDAPFHETTRVGAFFFTMFWVLGVVCWGRVIAKAIDDREAGLLEWLAYGTAGASLAGLLLALGGLIGWGTRPLFIGLTLAGPLLELGWVKAPAMRLPSRANVVRWYAGGETSAARRGLSALFIVAVFAEVCSRLNGASIAHYHSDPMVYHLYGPRLWAEAGRLTFTSLQPTASVASYWEYLAIWGNGLMGGPGGGGLVEGLLFMQWVHVLFGFAATALALERILSFFTDSSAWRRVSIFVALTSGILGWTAWLSKNDWGIAFWCLAGVSFLLRAEKGGARRRHALAAAGVMFGLAFAGKFPLALALLPLALAWAWRSSRRQDVGTVAIALAAVAAPHFLRLWIETGNPFFPAANGVFASPWLSRTMEETLALTQSARGHDLVHLTFDRMKLLIRQDPFFLAALVVAPVLGKRLGFLRYVPPFSLLAVLVAFGRPPGKDDGTLHLRYLGYALALGPGLALLSVRELIARMKPRARRAGVEVAVLLAVFAFGATRFKFPLVHELLDPVVAMRLSPPGGRAKAWLRMNAKPGSVIVTSGDDQLYPLSQFPVASMRLVPYLDWLSREVTDPELFVRELSRSGVQYVLDALTPDMRIWSMGSVTLRKAIFSHPEAVVFSSPVDSVVDLPRLYEAIFQSCSPDS